MKVYLGQARGSKLIRELRELGYGEATQRNEIPPRRVPWFLDNGAFADWTNGRTFDAWEFSFAVQYAWRAPVQPDFIVVPDLVAGGKDSVTFSMLWGRSLYGSVPLYVVLQDGMDQGDLDMFAHCFWVSGFFVGGTNDWKKASAKWIVDFAHSVGLPCHIGRVGTGRKVRWARQLGADSIDSAVPLFSTENLNVFVREVGHPLLDFATYKKGRQ